MTKAGVLYRLSATRPARCYGRHPTLRRSRAPAFHGSFKNRRLAPSTRGVGIHGDSGTESSETRKSLSRLDSHLPDRAKRFLDQLYQRLRLTTNCCTLYGSCVTVFH